MTRKDFIALAAAIKAVQDIDARRTVVENMLPYLRSSNVAFDLVRFLSACGL